MPRKEIEMSMIYVIEDGDSFDTLDEAIGEAEFRVGDVEDIISLTIREYEPQGRYGFASSTGREWTVGLDGYTQKEVMEDNMASCTECHLVVENVEGGGTHRYDCSRAYTECGEKDCDEPVISDNHDYCEYHEEEVYDQNVGWWR